MGEGTREEHALRGLEGSLDKEIKSLKLRGLLKGKLYGGNRGEGVAYDLKKDDACIWET